jgi:hypothetical protein
MMNTVKAVGAAKPAAAAPGHQANPIGGRKTLLSFMIGQHPGALAKAAVRS